jgi:hypothetical protein
MVGASVYLSCAVCLLGFSVNYCHDDACMPRGVFVELSIGVERESFGDGTHVDENVRSRVDTMLSSLCIRIRSRIFRELYCTILNVELSNRRSTNINTVPRQKCW